jgi:hypothetical protein
MTEDWEGTGMASRRFGRLESFRMFTAILALSGDSSLLGLCVPRRMKSLIKSLISLLVYISYTFAAQARPTKWRNMGVIIRLVSLISSGRKLFLLSLVEGNILCRYVTKS